MKTKYTAFALAAALAITSLAASASAQVSESGFDAVVNALTTGRNLIIADTPEGDGVDRAEGLRYLLRQVEFLLASQTDDHDVTTPTIQRCPSKICKLGFDNPDTSYVQVGPLNGNLSYRVSGHRGTVNYITYQILTIGPGGFSTGDMLESSELVIAEDGSYEIVLGGQNFTNAPNFMQIDTDGINTLIIRQLTNDWNTEIESSIAVDLLFSPPAPLSAPSFTPASLAQGGNIIKQQILGFLQLFRGVFENQLVTHSFPVPAAGSLGTGGGFPSNFVSASKYEVAVDEALIIEVPNTDTAYQNIQLGNIWSESRDYGTRVTSYNGAQEHVDADGVRRFVLAHTDPGVPNWLDIADHPIGGIFMRWQSPTAGDEPEAPQTTLVPLADVRNYLPASHPVVTVPDRAQILRNRLQGYNTRKNPANLEAFRDADDDGEHDSGDFCPGTPAGEEVDNAGCSQEQFCAQYEGLPMECRKADFLNDEPTSDNPKDCRDHKDACEAI
jgi:hypothetical protein